MHSIKIASFINLFPRPLRLGQTREKFRPEEGNTIE